MSSTFLKNFFRKDTTLRALKVSLVVSPVLILINQYDVIINMDYGYKFILKVALTILVPYCVSAYSSARAYTQQSKNV